MRKKENGKKKKRIFLKIILCLLALIILFILIKFGINYIRGIKDKKITNSINELSKDDVVFVEINPSLSLLINDNIIKEVACLNDDCIKIYNDINIKNLNISDGIATIYNKVKDYGFDISNGVKIKSTSNITIEDNDQYIVEVSLIDSNSEKELLNGLLNNKEVFNDNFKKEENLFEKLKKDSDYGKYYTCKNSNGKLRCFFNKELFQIDDDVSITDAINYAISRATNIVRILNKFNIKAKLDNIFGDDMYLYINDMEFNCSIDGLCTSSPHRFNDESIIENYSVWGDLELYDGMAGLDLLNPQEVLTHLLYSEEYDVYIDYFAETMVNLRSKKVCDNNVKNCKEYAYQYCNNISKTDTIEYKCRNITKNEYDQYYENNVKKSMGYGCYELDSFGLINQSICQIESYPISDINNRTVIGYVKCNGEVNSKNCQIINYTEKDFVMLSSTAFDGVVYIDDGSSNRDKACTMNKNSYKFDCK